MLSEHYFKALINTEETQLSDEEIWDFLVQLKLATEINEPKSLFIPSIINDDNEKDIRDQLKKFKLCDSSLSFHYKFFSSEQPTNLYNILLSKLAGKKQHEIYFEKGYSVKIENMSLGLVAGLCGSLRWATQCVDFLILEYDWNIGGDLFSRHKVLFFFLV